MFAGATGSGARLERSILANRYGVRFARMPVRQCFIREILHHTQANDAPKFVHAGRVLAILPSRAAFEDDHGVRSARGDLFRHKEAGEPASHYHHIYRFEALHIEKLCHIFRAGENPSDGPRKKYLPVSIYLSTRSHLRAKGNRPQPWFTMPPMLPSRQDMDCGL